MRCARANPTAIGRKAEVAAAVEASGEGAAGGRKTAQQVAKRGGAFVVKVQGSHEIARVQFVAPNARAGNDDFLNRWPGGGGSACRVAGNTYR